MAAPFRHACAVVLVATFALGVNTASAQFRAGVQGTVADQSGGAIPGATVVVLNQETGVSNDTVTNETGFYRVSGLPPGRYKVTATLSGFKESVADNVQVSAEEIRGLNVVLEPGGVQETVTVVGGSSVLHTENADIAGTLGTVEIQRLPQIGRDPYELVRLTPGVFGLGARSGTGDAVGLPNQSGPGDRTTRSSRPRTRCRSPRTVSGWSRTAIKSMV